MLPVPLACEEKSLLAHHPPSILHASQQRNNGRSAIELALQQVQRAGKHPWIQEKNSEREFQRKFFLLIPLSKGKETEKACLHRLLPSHVTRTKSFPPLVLFKTKFSVSQRVWNCEFFFIVPPHED